MSSPGKYVHAPVNHKFNISLSIQYTFLTVLVQKFDQVLHDDNLLLLIMSFTLKILVKVQSQVNRNTKSYILACVQALLENRVGLWGSGHPIRACLQLIYFLDPLLGSITFSDSHLGRQAKKRC